MSADPAESGGTTREQQAEILTEGGVPAQVEQGQTLEDLATMENVYSPPIGALNEPIALAAQNGLANLAAKG